MTKFAIVSLLPKALPEGSYVVEDPTFMEEVLANKGREPRGGLTASTHLRYIVGTIASRYDESLSAMGVKTYAYEGHKYSSDRELADIVVKLLREQHPQVFNKVLDAKIKARPQNTKLIYYTGDFLNTQPFFENSIDQIDEKDVDVYLGFKPKKVVGKPAVKDEE